METSGQCASCGTVYGSEVNVVVEGLFAKYPTVEALAEADVNNIEEIVRPCGLGKSKAG